MQRRHDWNATIRRLEKILDRDPRSRLFLPLAEAYRETGRLERSAQVFQSGLEHHPNYLRARVGLARTLAALERSEEAQRELHQVLSLVPDNLMARELLAGLYRDAGLLEQAAAEYRILLRHLPGSSDLRGALAAVQGRDRNGEGPADPLERWQEVSPPGGGTAGREAAARPASGKTDPDRRLASGGWAESSVASPRDIEPPWHTPRAETTEKWVAQFRRLFALPSELEAGVDPDPVASVRLLFPGAFHSTGPPEAREREEPEGRDGTVPEEVGRSGAGGALEPEAAEGDAGGEPILLGPPQTDPEPGPGAELLESMAEPRGCTIGSGAAARPEDGARSREPLRSLALAEVYLQQGHLGEARAMLEEVLRAEPENRAARERLEVLLTGTGASSTEVFLCRWLGAIETVKRQRGLAVLAGAQRSEP